MLQRFINVYFSWVVGRPKRTLLLLALITLALAAGLPNFKLDASADSLTLENDDSLNYFREITKRYQANDFLVVTYKPNHDLFSDESLAALASLRDDLAQVEGVASVMSMLDVPLLYSPMVSLRGVTDAPRKLLQADTDRALAKKEFTNSPIYRDMLLGPDGQTTALLVNLKVDNKYLELVRARDDLRLKLHQQGLSADDEMALARASKEFLDYRTAADTKSHERVVVIRSIVNSYKDRATLFLGGATMITADMVEFIRSDLVVFGSGITLFILITMALIFRQVRFVVLPLLTCVMSVVMVLGLLSWIDWRLTVISSNFVALLLIITLSLTIHLAVRFRELHVAHNDWTKAQLVSGTVSSMFMPCLYTVLTTMVAFMSLVVSGIRPVIDFGWMMAIGLAIAFVLGFVLIPAGLMLWPNSSVDHDADKYSAITLSFSRFTERNGRGVFWISLLLGLISIYGISRLEVENRFIDYFHDTTEIHQGMLVIDQNLGGTTTLDIILDVDHTASAIDAGSAPVKATDAADPFADDQAEEDADPFDDDGTNASATSTTKPSHWFSVAGFEEVQRLHDYLESLPEVGKVQSLATLYKVMNDINGGRLNDFEIAVVRKSLPAEINDALVKPYFSADDDQVRITLRAKEADPHLRRAELIEKIRTFAVNEGGFKPEQIHFSGVLVLYNNMLQSLFSSQILSIGVVFLGIMAMFVLLFRSLTVSFIAIVPNILAASIVLGAMGLAGVPLDMMTITIASVTVGIGVDDCVHYLHRFREEFAIDGDYVAAMHRCHGSIGPAMFYTSVIIVVGFSILVFSEFIPSIYFGLLTAFSMFVAIIGALLLLPQLILMMQPFGRPLVVEAGTVAHSVE